MVNLSRVGLINPGDTITLIYKGALEEYVVDEVLGSGTQEEEILLDLQSNKYFITLMAIDGSSWAKNVIIIKGKQ